MAVNSNSKSSGCTAAAIVAIAFCGVLFLWMCFTKVPANAIGVRTNINGGIEQMDFKPGYVMAIPFLHTVRLWDPTWTDVFQQLPVRSSDQYLTIVDVSVVFRIKPGKCYEVAGSFKLYSEIEQNVKLSLGNFANKILIKMKTEDFYNAEIRDKATAELKSAMDEQLEKWGLEVKSVLLRNIKYDENYETLLLNKQKAGQTLSLETSKTEQVKGEMETEKIRKEAEAEVAKLKEGITQDVANRTAVNEQEANNLLQDAMLESAVITAKATADNRVKKSEAELLRSSATAYGVAAMSKVYAKPGASYYFAQKALQGLKLGSIEVNSSTFNPLETEKLLKALGLDLRSAQPQPQPQAPAPK